VPFAVSRPTLFTPRELPNVSDAGFIPPFDLPQVPDADFGVETAENGL
jgi:hypothetical protein